MLIIVGYHGDCLCIGYAGWEGGIGMLLTLLSGLSAVRMGVLGSILFHVS